MSQSRREIVKLFEKDVSEANRDVPDDKRLSEYDEVLIIYYAHYREYTEDFDRIISQNPQFFDFG